jgi:hypothetical protein
MVTFSFRKFLKCVESNYATCETYRDNGWIQQRSGSGCDDDNVWKVIFKTEFDRQGLFRFEWRDQTDVFTQHFPNPENVVWANKYGAFGRFDFEENTHHFLDLAQALDAACGISSGVAPLVAAMLYPELRNIFERPTSRQRPSRVELLERDKKNMLSIVWQRTTNGVVASRQVLFDVDDFCVREIFETARRMTPGPASVDLTEPESFDGVLGYYLSTAGSSWRGAASDPGDVVSSTRIVFEDVLIAPSNLALLRTHID